MKEFEIEGTISAFTMHLQDVAGSFKDVWFRGQPDYEFKLRPGLFREGSECGVNINGSEMFHEFQRRYPDQSVSHKTTFEWLTLMQHYGLPTRLLDWSSNLLVGIYFCCIDKQFSGKDGAVYVLDPSALSSDISPFMDMQIVEKSQNNFFRRLILGMGHDVDPRARINGHSIEEIRKSHELIERFTGYTPSTGPGFFGFDIPLRMVQDRAGAASSHEVTKDMLRLFSDILAFKPPYLNSRIRQQHGFFTLHGGMYIEGRQFIRVEDMEAKTSLACSLLKIRIKAGKKQSLLKELAYAGIKESTLFPDMEYQVREIKALFSKQCL